MLYPAIWIVECGPRITILAWTYSVPSGSWGCLDPISKSDHDRAHDPAHDLAQASQPASQPTILNIDPRVASNRKGTFSVCFRGSR